MNSENLFSQSYGVTTAKALTKRHTVGHNINAKERFKSQNSSQYRSKNFRRFADKPFMEPRKDYDDYSRFINDTYVEEKTEMLNQTMSFHERRKSHTGQKNYNPILSLQTYSDLEQRPMTMANTKRGGTTKNANGYKNPFSKG